MIVDAAIDPGEEFLFIVAPEMPERTSRRDFQHTPIGPADIHVAGDTQDGFKAPLGGQEEDAVVFIHLPKRNIRRPPGASFAAFPAIDRFKNHLRDSGPIAPPCVRFIHQNWKVSEHRRDYLFSGPGLVHGKFEFFPITVLTERHKAPGAFPTAGIAARHDRDILQPQDGEQRRAEATQRLKHCRMPFSQPLREVCRLDVFGALQIESVFDVMLKFNIRVECRQLERAFLPSGIEHFLSDRDFLLIQSPIFGYVLLNFFT